LPDSLDDITVDDYISDKATEFYYEYWANDEYDIIDYSYVYDENYDFYTDYWANDEYDINFDDFDYYTGSQYVYEQLNPPDEEPSFFEEVWDNWGW
jgi:hypothetical protein